MKKNIFIFVVPVFLFLFASIYAQTKSSKLKQEGLSFLESAASNEIAESNESPVTDELSNTDELPVTEVLACTKTFTIEEFGFPLPQQYNKWVSSEQGLREVISAENTGGLATSGKWHNGIDFAVPEKTPVYAAKSGVISTVYPSYYNGPYAFKGHPVYGGLIVIRHDDGTITLYGHLSYTEVMENQRVEKGQEIGWSGGKRGQRGSGASTGPHLHFSVYIDMEQVVTL